jgi:zinc protease
MHAVRAAAALLVLLLVAAAGPAPAATPVLDATLGNGLRVLVLEDRRSPVVSLQVWYRVGARNERPGATGLAHLLEHMMFKGTATYGKGEFARIVEQHGGQHNAFTSRDITGYFVNIAADQVERVLALEVDRMRHLLLEPAEIDAERQVVLEERRTRTDDDPDGLLGEEVSALAFTAHPYGWPIIGWRADVERITPADLRAFYDTYYVPNNAVLAVVGDVDAPALLARIRALFGPIPRGADPPPVTVVEPSQRGERRVTLRRAEARLPIVYVAYHVPNHRSADAPALELLSVILSGGRASRLSQRLVHEARLALSVDADYGYSSLDPGLFWLYGSPMPGRTAEELERALQEELERLQREPVAAEELGRAQNQIEAGFVWRQDSVRSRASSLARFETMGSWRLLDRFVPMIRSVTPGDIQRVARTYFPPERRTVGVLLPVEPKPSPGN